ASTAPVGLGLSMEATHNNPDVFELLADQAWARVDVVDRDWLPNFVAQRYGRCPDPALLRAWDGLTATFCGAGVVRTFPERLHRGWEHLVEAAERDPQLAHGPLGHDLVEIAMAVMARVADHTYLALVEQALREGVTDPVGVEQFLQLFDDLDSLLVLRPEFTFQQWEDRAASWADDSDEHKVLVDNARRIITVWDAPESPFLNDYAGRLWAGLVRG